jgi:hypothetical protein
MQTTLLRGEMATGFEARRVEMHKGSANLHRELATQLWWMVGILRTAFIGLTAVFTAIVDWLR